MYDSCADDVAIFGIDRLRVCFLANIFVHCRGAPCRFTRFCGLKGHEMFCEVERAYIEDGFNLYGLRACVSNFSDCLDLILDRIGPDDSDDSHLTQSACTLYGLIHARYIVTAHGLDSMYNKVKSFQAA